MTKKSLGLRDAHYHHGNYSLLFLSYKKILQEMDRLGIKRTVLMTIPTPIFGKPDKAWMDAHGVQDGCYLATYYVTMKKYLEQGGLDPETVKFLKEAVTLRFDPSVDYISFDRLNLDLMKGNLNPADLDRFDHAMTCVDLGSMRIADQMVRMAQHLWQQNHLLRHAVEGMEFCFKDPEGKEPAGKIPRLEEAACKGPESEEPARDQKEPGVTYISSDTYKLLCSHLGEFTITKELVDELQADIWSDLKTNIEPTREALLLAGVMGVAATVHCDIGPPATQKDLDRATVDEKKYYGAAKNLKGIKRLFSMCPRTKIIWAHAGGLGRYGFPSKEHVSNIREVLENFKHVNIDMSWSTVGDKVLDDEFIGQWAGLMLDCPERFLYGSDGLTPASGGRAWMATYDKYDPKLKDAIHAEALEREMAELPEEATASQRDQATANATEIANDVWAHFTEKNHERLIVGSRKPYQFFMDYVAPSIPLHDIESASDPETQQLPDHVEPLSARRVQEIRDTVYDGILRGEPITDPLLGQILPTDQALAELRRVVEDFEQLDGISIPSTPSLLQTTVPTESAAVSRAPESVGMERLPSNIGRRASTVAGMRRQSPPAPLNSPQIEAVNADEEAMRNAMDAAGVLELENWQLKSSVMTLEARNNALESQLAIEQKRVADENLIGLNKAVTQAVRNAEYRADALQSESYLLNQQNAELYKTLQEAVDDNNKLEDKIKADKDTAIDRLRKLKTEHKNLAAIHALKQEIKAAPAKRRILKSMANLATSVLPGVRTRFPAYRLGSDGTHAPFIEVERRAQIRKLEAEIQRDVNAALENPESLVR